MVAIGVYFTRKNQNTDDYFRVGNIFRGGAGLSIFRHDAQFINIHGHSIKSICAGLGVCSGNLMIPVTAVVAVYVAMPFFRHIDATSAYEYLRNVSIGWFVFW